jgi:hypothetical protein
MFLANARVCRINSSGPVPLLFAFSDAGPVDSSDRRTADPLPGSRDVRPRRQHPDPHADHHRVTVPQRVGHGTPPSPLIHFESPLGVAIPRRFQFLPGRVEVIEPLLLSVRR